MLLQLQDILNLALTNPDFDGSREHLREFFTPTKVSEIQILLLNVYILIDVNMIANFSMQEDMVITERFLIRVTT